MRRIPDTPCPSNALAYLQHIQQDIDTENDFHDRVEKAVRCWNNKNGSKDGKAAFDAIKTTLDSLRSAGHFCCYCETGPVELFEHAANSRPQHSPIEHIFPKSLYPEYAFIWENYLPICERCNTNRKLDQWAVFDRQGWFHDVTPPHTKGARRVSTRVGSPLFLNPRHEDPSTFLRLDFADFKVKPLQGLTYIDASRAAYTIKTLTLNDGPLTHGRHTGFGNICNTLRTYLERRNIDRVRTIFRDLQYPMVWQEMKRQSSHPLFAHLLRDEMQHW